MFTGCLLINSPVRKVEWLMFVTEEQGIKQAG